MKRVLRMAAVAVTGAFAAGLLIFGATGAAPTHGSGVVNVAGDVSMHP